MKTAIPCLALLAPAALAAAPPSGEEVYKKRCAACHEQSSPRVPGREALRQMSAARIVRALDAGAMMAVAMTMSRDDRIAVAGYLGSAAKPAPPPAKAYCASRSADLSRASGESAWNGWSPDAANTRFQPSSAARLTVEQTRGLKLKWAFGFDGDVTGFAPPTVIAGYVFIGSAAGVVHALDAHTGCIEWTFEANGPVRSAIVAAPLPNGRHALLFGDMTGWFYALDAATGAALWKRRIETHDSTRLTGAPAAWKGVVYIPVASWEETRAAEPEYQCCTFRGSVVALRVADGAQVWKSYLVPEPAPTGRNARGALQFGPSGVGVWSAPTVDEKRNLIYVTTGDNYSLPATELSDAVVALNPATGKVVWAKQTIAGDAFNAGCGNQTANCPKGAGPDFDFASSAILTSGPDGRGFLLAGQKSGIVFALDPDRKGAEIWRARVGEGGTNGGVQWGMTTDGSRVYAAVSDVGRMPKTDPLDPRRALLDPKTGGGVTALRIADGSRAWHALPAPCPAGARSGCSPAQPGALTGIPGIVFATSMDGHIRAHASEDGRVVWDFDTMRAFETVNGVPAHGGSIDGPGPVVVDGMVFVSSGYPRNGGVPGNVLLAFGVSDGAK